MLYLPCAHRKPIRFTVLGLTYALGVMLLTGCERQETPLARQPHQPSADGSNAGKLEDHTALAASAIARGQLDVAEQSLRQGLLIAPNDAQALELSADIAIQRKNASTAIEMYQAAIDARGSAASRELLDKWAKSLLRAGKPYDSIKALQKICESFPADPQSRYDLAGIAAAFGVPELAVPPLAWLVQKGQSDAESLLLLADPARVKPDKESCKKSLSLSNEDHRAEYGLARHDAMSDDWAAVAKRLEPIVTTYPEFVEAYALYLQALFELGENDKFTECLRKAPPLAAGSSVYWITLGRWEQSRGQHHNAAIAFWESFKKGTVTHPEALTYLYVSLTQINRNDEARLLSGLIAKDTELRDSLMLHIERASVSQAACMRVADALQDLGRIWEAEGWARLAVTLPDDKLPDLRERYLAIRGRLQRETPWQLPEDAAASLIDLSDLSWTSNDFTPIRAATFHGGDVGRISFVDEASARQWHHTSVPATQSGTYTIEKTSGGGIAVIDFDCDGWPDLAAASLDGTALRNDSSSNRLSRNLNGVFADVSERAGYIDTGYGQGIAVADYNDDGFADLFDANIGRNRLYRNNGDGTFSDVSEAVGLNGERWTTSVAMVDLNGDSILDIFEVNYCAGTAPYERNCRSKFGLTVCSPMSFDAEPDRVWQGRIDGTFIDVTDSWMQPTSYGRGLGLVVGELDNEAGMDVVVSNDMTVNHLWTSPTKGPLFKLVDVGVVRGVATNGKSQSQASMGIAASDADGDGDIDLLMTHFSDEHNTYYEQVTSGFWSDRSYPCGFVESSLKLLGFGTQFVDFDNNGSMELIITNGHVDQVDRADLSYRMPPQLYWRTVSGRWEELDPKSLGKYFEKDYLGRALVRLDVNRDGRCDVAISHLGEPVALLVNSTPDAGQAIVMELKGTSSSRDAIGARVYAEIGGRKVVAHLTGGDGYMASNERRIHIGCAAETDADNVVVDWPSGNSESFGSLESGREYLIVEGAGQAFEMRKLP